ncbi:MAG: GxxExxY protein [Planctomycetes bacterium]|nr:GxxExxY protein [Planctomycetota bacterium]
MNRQSAKTPRREPEEELDDLAHRVIGAAIEVHTVLGPGHLESAYEKALAIEFGERGIPFERQKPFQVKYKGRPVVEGRLDFLVAGRLVVEIKAADRLAPVHKAQVISYLKATGHHLGLLMNFNEVLLPDGLQRVVLS